MILKILLLTNLLLLVLSLPEDYYKDLECPFPEGQSVSSEDECRKYSTCDWNDQHCHMLKNAEAGYGMQGDAETTRRGSKMTLKKLNSWVTMFHDDISELTFEIIDHEDYHVQIKIYDRSKSRYEVPVPLNLPETPAEHPKYIVKHSSSGEPFHFSVGRRGSQTENELFNLVGPLTFEDQFLQVTTTLPSTYMYGMGENAHTSFKHIFVPRQTTPIFPRDHEVLEEVLNTYGHQPYYVIVDPNTRQAHSVLLHNSNAMEYSTFLLHDGTPALTLRTIGGILDFHIFLGPSLEDVNRQYINTIGLPMLPPYWVLGFQLSRDGYTGPEEVRQIHKIMKESGIPQDVQFFDVNYMEDRRDFTLDQENWKELPDFIKELHNDSMKVTVILDPPIASDFDKYPPSQRGKDADVYIKWLSESYVPEDQDPSWGTYMVGRVWPPYPAVFPDFFNPDTHTWWADEINLFQKEVDFDGIWIDMNEVTNFGTNSNETSEHYPNKTDLLCPDNRLDNPPYPTMMTRIGGSMSHRISETTICMSGNQTDGQNQYLHYDVHSLYGWSHTIATYKAMVSMNPGKRPMLLTRSTFPGSGQYGIHWLGDNTSKWEHMKMSIIGILEFNFFGIPMVGADICGFNGNATMELCARWMQLGSFYPYSRNHNCGEQGQDPTAWSEVAMISRLYLRQRYVFHPYLYMLLYKAHVFGESVARPLFSLDLGDTKALEVDDQFLLGDGLMIAPVLYPGAVSRDVYFPKGDWYDYLTLEKIISGPATIKVEAPLKTIPAFIRGGVMYPIQEEALTVTESRKEPFGILVVFNSTLEAEGAIFMDDGETELHLQTILLAKMTFKDMTLKIDVLSTPSEEFQRLDFISLCPFPSRPKVIELNGEPLLPEEWIYSTDGDLQVYLDMYLSKDITLTFYL